MEKDDVETAVLHAFEISLQAQLKAIKRVRAGSQLPPKTTRQGMSQITMVYDILKRSGKPLHIADIIERVEKIHGRRLDRESIVSALVKKVNRGDRFVRTDKNVFGLKGGE